MQDLGEGLSLDTYHKAGYLLVPSFFDEASIRSLRETIHRAADAGSAGKTLEQDGDTLRILYGVHSTGGLLSRIARHPALLSLCQEIIGEPVYLYQSKTNFKAAFVGSGFEWHQDFAFWRNRDGLPRPSVVNIVIFLDEVSVFNGPMFLIPGSQQLGLLESERNVVPHQQVGKLASRFGMVAATGLPGTILLFGGLMVHGSPPNTSPFDRALLLLTYSGISNVVSPDSSQSPDHLAAANPTALDPLEIDSIFPVEEAYDAASRHRRNEE